MIRTLNSLRFILILMIVISHSTLPISQGMHDYLGECPVAIFFVISGFVLSLSKGEKLQKGELTNKQFFLSRIIKLYPLHLFIFAIILLLDWRLGYLGTWYQALAHATLVQCWVPTHQFIAAYNAPTWFLSDIIIFYLIFKYLYKWLMNISWKTILPIMGVYMASYVLLSFKMQEDYSAGFIYFYPPFRMIDFMLGILLYRFYCSEWGRKITTHILSFPSAGKAHILDTLLILMIVGMYYLSIHCNPNFRCAALYWLSSLIVVFYVTAIDKGKGWLTSLLHNKLLLWLGSISMEIFLIHSLSFRIIQSIFLKIYGEDIPIVGEQFCVALALMVVMAWAAKKYIVIPVYNKKKFFELLNNNKQ